VRSMQVQSPPDFESQPAQLAGSMDAVPASQPEVVTSRRRYRFRELILLCVLIVDAFLALDFVFRAKSISQGGFVSVVDRVGNALASPFTGIFGSRLPHVGHTTFWAALLALAVYTIAALVLVRLLHLLGSPLRRQPAPA
jgi:hypothetical protein